MAPVTLRWTEAQKQLDHSSNVCDNVLSKLCNSSVTSLLRSMPYFSMLPLYSSANWSWLSTHLYTRFVSVTYVS